ncbi:MAG: hypothetical protein GC192_01830 [Bacteroidetes bacterium]|nr:hypothetical protein [Bacteroidota bacterium]
MKLKALKLLITCFILVNQLEAINGPYLPTTTNFELIRGMVVVQAELDGSIANFILDTGSPMMILNEKNAISADFQANNLQGGMRGEWKNIDMFAWAGVRKFDLKALTTDISALEMVTGKPIAGLIGYDFLEDFELLIDFDRLLVTLVPAGAVAKMEDWSLRKIVPFTFAGHLPVIEAKIGDVQLRLGLDTGCNTNMLNNSKAEELDAELVTPVSNAGVIGMSGESININAADVVETNIGGLNFWNMRFVFSDISHLQNLVDNGVDGLLGFPFFKSGKFSLNYTARTISIWE